MKHMYIKDKDVSITTERLLLHTLTPQDVSETYVGWLNDPEVTKYLETKSATLESSRAYVAEKLRRPDELFLGIFLRGDGRHIGNIKLESIDLERKTATMSIMIGDKSTWGKGFASEAISGLVRYAFGELDVKKVNLGVLPENIAAIKAYEKVGFKETARVKVTREGGGNEQVNIKMAVTPETFVGVDAAAKK